MRALLNGTAFLSLLLPCFHPGIISVSGHAQANDQTGNFLGGNSSYELQALIASANSCVLNLATLLAVVDSDEQTNVHPLKRDESIITENTRSKKPG